jgi:F0F1-type ATP synthase delta subunit
MSQIIITTAAPVPQELKPQLESKLVAKIGNYPFVYDIDESLIAGLQVSFGDTEYHYDLKSEIEYLTNELV